MISIDEALELVLRGIEPLDAERVPQIGRAHV